MNWAIKHFRPYRYWLVLAILTAVFFGCLTKQEPDTFTLPEKFVDSLSRYDSVQIVLKETSGKTLDVLFQGKVVSADQLRDLPAPHALDGKMIVTIIGYQGGQVTYRVDRVYDGKTHLVETHQPIILPTSKVLFGAQELHFPKKTTIPLPIVTVEPADLADKSLVWTSSNPKVFEIFAMALRGVAPGTAYLRVSLKSDTAKHADLPITVLPNPKLPDSLRLSPDTLKLAAKGRIGHFTVQVFPAFASGVSWSIVDTAVASIAGEGQVQGLRRGTAFVRVVSKEDETISDSAMVSVSDPVPVESVRFPKNKLDLFVDGAAESLQVEVRPEEANPEVDFSVRDSSVAAILNGRVSGLRAGVTYVVAKSLENALKTDSLQLTVFPSQKVDSIRVSPDTLKLIVGGEPKTLQAKLYPTTLSSLIQWTTASSAIAVVDSAGKVRPVAEGKTLVGAMSKADSGKKSTSLILVNRDVPILDVGRDTTIQVGRTMTFTPKVTQEYGNVNRFKWDLNGDGAWDDSAAEIKSVSYKYDQEKETAALFYVRDTEGNDTTVMKRVKAVKGPAINIFAPLNNSYSNKSPIAVAWSVDGKDQELFLKEILKEGANTVTRTAKDSLGNVYSASITVYYDTTAPNQPIVKGPAATGSSTPIWTWTSGGKGGVGVYRSSLDKDEFTGVSESADTTYTPDKVLKEDVHTLYVQERDAAGNWSSSGRFVIRVDLSGPGTPIVKVSPAIITNVRKPVWSWARGEGGTGAFRLKLDNADLKTGSMATTDTSFSPTDNLANGAHTLYVQEKDSVGNWSLSGSAQVFVDIIPPNPPLFESAIRSPTNDRQPTWTWRTGGNGGRGWFRYKMDDSILTIGATTGTNVTVVPNAPGLTEGIHTIYVQEQDSAGNWSLTTGKSIQIDLTPPNVPVASSITLHTINLRPTWSWSSGGGGNGAYRYKFGDSSMQVGAISTSEKNYSPLSDLEIGEGYTLYVQEQDSAGNWSQTLKQTLKIHGQIGYAVGSNIFQTKDGGIRWDSASSRPTEVSSASFVSVYFANVQTGFSIDYNGILVRTKNGGISWDTNSIKPPGAFVTSLTSVCFPNPNIGYVLNGFGTIAKTSNGGASWIWFPISPFLFSITFTDSETGYAVGNEGTILKTVNGGSHWDSLPRVTSELLHAVHFLNATTGFACGSAGTIIKTSDGGKTWATLSSGTGQYLNSVFFPGPETGFAVGIGGTIIKTTDGGVTWKSLPSGTEKTLKSVFFTDLNVGYAVGVDGKMLLTRDGGASWTVRSIGTNSELTSVFFP
ncbi:MAG: YCF48-related protein [Fibrobacteria bacterium]